MKRIIVLFLLLSLFACTNNVSDSVEVEQVMDSTKKEIVDSISTFSYFKGEAKWVKHFQCDGYISNSHMISDSIGSIYWMFQLEGILTIDSTNTLKSYNGEIHLLKFNKKGELKNSRMIETVKGGMQLLNLIKHKKQIYFSITSSHSFGDNYPMLPARKGSKDKNYAFLYEIGLEGEVLLVKEFVYPRNTTVKAIQLDRKGYIIISGAEKLRADKNAGIIICYDIPPKKNSINIAEEDRERSIPFVEKHSNNGIEWKVSCTNSCLGSIDNIMIDNKNNIWAKVRVSSCPALECLNIPSNKSTRSKEYIVKLSEDGEYLLKKETSRYSYWSLTISKFNKDKILIHCGASCFNHGGEYPPVRAYNTELNQIWESCFTDSINTRLNLAILPQTEQILAVGNKRTGMIQPGESADYFLNKQKVVFLRYDTVGNLEWSKTLQIPVRVKHFIEGVGENFYFLGKSDNYSNIGKRLDYGITIDSVIYNTEKKQSYFLIGYQ